MDRGHAGLPELVMHGGLEVEVRIGTGSGMDDAGVAGGGDLGGDVGPGLIAAGADGGADPGDDLRGLGGFGEQPAEGLHGGGNDAGGDAAPAGVDGGDRRVGGQQYGNAVGGDDAKRQVGRGDQGVAFALIATTGGGENARGVDLARPGQGGSGAGEASQGFAAGSGGSAAGEKDVDAAGFRAPGPGIGGGRGQGLGSPGGPASMPGLPRKPLGSRAKARSWPQAALTSSPRRRRRVTVMPFWIRRC